VPSGDQALAGRGTSLQQVNALAPLATQAVATSSADNPGDMAIAVTGVDEIHEGATGSSFTESGGHRVQNATQVMAHCQGLTLIPFADLADTQGIVKNQHTPSGRGITPRLDQPIL